MMNTELVFIPSPGVGHIMSTIEVAKLLVNRDHRLFITIFIIKPPSSDSGSAITTYIESLVKKTMAHISFIQLPQDDILPVWDSKAPFTYYDEFIKSHCKYVRQIVADKISQPGSCRVSGLVIDMFCTTMMDVANEFNIPTYVFFTSNAAFLGFYLYVQRLVNEQNRDVVGLSHSDTEIPITGFVKPVPTKVFWPIVRTKEGLEFVLSSAQKLRQAKGIMVNSFSELETHAFKSLSDDISIPPVYPVGPILSLEGGDDDIIRWLDSQPPSSVVFLCFGSKGCFDEIQVKEIARALEQSGYRFLWSLRRPPSSDQTLKVPGEYEDPRVVLPDGFVDRTSGFGKVIGWAPQVKVLAHRSVGGFVSHCGWNSVLESLWFGVPTATWPVYAEQHMNAFEMVVELGLGVELTLDYENDLNFGKANKFVVKAQVIERSIRKVMEDNEVRAKVKEMGDKSRAAVEEGGSSYASVGRLIQDITGIIS